MDHGDPPATWGSVGREALEALEVLEVLEALTVLLVVGEVDAGRSGALRGECSGV